MTAEYDRLVTYRTVSWQTSPVFRVDTELNGFWIGVWTWPIAFESRQSIECIGGVVAHEAVAASP
jgi:hypothetical protein